MMQRKLYDIAIVDLMMPRLSGYELVQKISTLTPRPTVIVATALMNGDVSSLDDSMVRRVIKKPFDFNAVANALIETAREIAEQGAGTSPPTTAIVAADANIVIPSDAKITPTEAAPGEKPVKPSQESPRKNNNNKVPPPEKIE